MILEKKIKIEFVFKGKTYNFVTQTFSKSVLADPKAGCQPIQSDARFILNNIDEYLKTNGISLEQEGIIPHDIVVTVDLKYRFSIENLQKLL